MTPAALVPPRPSGVPAMRLGKYKAHFMTTGAVACRAHDGQPRPGPPKTFTHDPPLVFDLEEDPGENTPVDPSTIAASTSRAAPHARKPLAPPARGAGSAASNLSTLGSSLTAASTSIHLLFQFI